MNFFSIIRVVKSVKVPQRLGLPLRQIVQTRGLTVHDNGTESQHQGSDNRKRA